MTKCRPGLIIVTVRKGKTDDALKGIVAYGWTVSKSLMNGTLLFVQVHAGTEAAAVAAARKIDGVEDAELDLVHGLAADDDRDDIIGDGECGE